MPEYVLHIGPHKTGTTYLQRGFTRLAPALQAAGVLYPLDLGTPGHELLVRRLAQPETLAATFATLNSSDAQRILLSAEDFAPLRPPAIAALRQLIGDHPVRVVFSCRRWSELLASRWVERVKRGHCGTLADDLAATLAAPAASPQINHALVLDRWAAAFGEASLRLISLQAVIESGVGLGAHFQAAILGVATADADAGDQRNPSLPLVEAELLRALNVLRRAHGHTPDGAWRRVFVRQRRRRRLPLDRSAAAIAADIVPCRVDETAPALAALHTALHRRYRDRIVPPALADGLFTPRQADIPCVGGGYIDTPGVRAELAAAYAVMVRGTPPAL